MQTLNAYLTGLASSEPTPGGGSAAMIVAAMAASLVAMVARISLENDGYSEHHARLREIISQSDALREQCETARTRDEDAYRHVVDATALPKNTPEEKAARTDALQDALRGAAEAPLDGAKLCVRVLHLTSEALAVRNRHLVSDLGCAAEFAASAVAACAYNVRINHRFIKDPDAIASQAAQLAREEREAESLLQAIRDEVNAQLR